MKINLVRKKTTGDGVKGELTFPLTNGNFTAPTLENVNYLIPDGNYQLDWTWSPKFKKFMPEVMDVPNREGIRIHMGTLPEHSTGCILVDFRTMQVLNAVLKTLKYREDEEITLCISSTC